MPPLTSTAGEFVHLQKEPRPELGRWIQSVWFCRAPSVAHPQERVLPNGNIQVVLNLARDYLTGYNDAGQISKQSPCIVVGASNRFELIDTGDFAELVGIVVRPGAFASFFGHRADLFFSQSVCLRSVWPRFSLDPVLEAPTPTAKLHALEALLLLQAGKAAVPDSLVAFALQFLARPGNNVGDCVSYSGLSARRFSQTFREQAGLSPKLWSRIRRFQKALGALHRGVNVRWTDLAQDCGYYDQSHFVNDFQAFSGVNPTTYSVSRRPWRNHLAINR